MNCFLFLKEMNEPKEKVDEICHVLSESSSSDDACSKYEDLNVRAKRLSDSLKRLSTQSETNNAIVESKDVEAPEEKESEEVQEILKRYSHILGWYYYNLLQQTWIIILLFYASSHRWL